MPPPLKIYWWSPLRPVATVVSEIRHHSAAWIRLGVKGGSSLSNYGDELNRPLFEALTNRSVTWATIRDADIVGVGSVLLPVLSSGGTARVWGSGLSAPPDRPPDLTHEQKERILAVRGPLTRAALGLSAGTPIGDPGLLAPSLIPPRRSIDGARLVIPHFTVFNTAAGVRKVERLQRAGFRIVLPTWEPKTVIEHIAAADAVYSSGLHGVILAHAFGRPATLFRFADAHTALPFKYGDYFESIGVDQPRVCLWHQLLDSGVVRDSTHEATGEDRAIRPFVARRIDELLESGRAFT